MRKLIIWTTVSVLTLLCTSGGGQAQEPFRALAADQNIDCTATGAKTDPRYTFFCSTDEVTFSDTAAATKISRILLVDLGERELKKRQKLR